MANVKFQRSEVESAIGRKLNDETVAKIALFGCPVESLTEEEIELEIFPNRPDLLSQEGFLRAFKAFLGKDTGLKTYKLNKSGEKLIVEKSLPKEWPYAIACIVKGIKFDDAKIKKVIDIQEKLASTLLRRRKKGGIGLYPLEKITFPVRFTGMDPEKIKFRPLEYPTEITGRQILSKHPTGREYAPICENWDKLPVFIDKKGVIMSMPPIINSHDVGKIDETTENVFLEATGNDLNILKKAINIISTSLAEMGGKVYTINCVQQNNKSEEIPNLTPDKMSFSMERANKLLGTNLKESDTTKLLGKMGLGVQGKSVLVPAWRTDILHEVDLIEEIAIAYEYDNLTPEVPQVSTVAEEAQEDKFKNKMKEILVGLGLLEVSSFHMIKQNEAEIMKFKEPIEVENSKTEYKILRPNLLIPALRILTENKDHEYPQEFFEIGTTFEKSDKEETGIKENQNLLVLQSPANFTKLKQTLNYLLTSLGVEYALKEHSHAALIDGRSASVLVNGKEVGYLGELHPSTLQDWTIKMPAAVMEINLEEVFETLRK